jgi:hypothetical protein
LMPNTKIISRGLAGIFEMQDDEDRLILKNNVAFFHQDISAQLPFLRVFHDERLLAGKDGSSYRAAGGNSGQNQGGPTGFSFKSPMTALCLSVFFVVSVVTFTYGLWCCHRRLFAWVAVCSYPVIIISFALLLIWWLWPSESASGFFGASGVSASRYSRTEDVHVFPIVVAELKFRDVQRHVFTADFVERADDPALHQRPEALNRVGVNCADNVFLVSMAHESVREFLAKLPVAAVIVGGDKADLVGYGFENKTLQCVLVAIFDDAGDNLTLALDCADDGRFAGTSAAGAAVALIPMPVARLATDYVSSTSTMPPSLSGFSARPARIRLHM